MSILERRTLTQTIGDPITTEQCTWAILKEIHSPIVGDLEHYSSVGYALEYCNRPAVFNCLSGGEKRLVKIAQGVFSMNENLLGAGIASIGGLDRDTRRRVWLYIGYLYLGREALSFATGPSPIDWSQVRDR